MKKNTKNLALLFCLASLNFTSVAQALPLMENVKLLDKIDFKDKTLFSYTTDTSLDLNEKSIQERLNRLEDYTGVEMMDREIKESGKDNLLIQDPSDSSLFFNINYHSGSFSYSTGMEKYYEEDSTKNLLHEKDALYMTYKHLENLDLMPQKEQLGLITQGGLNMSVKKENGNVADYEKMTSVRIDRRLNDMPVLGDSRIFINMGTDGEIANMIYQWNNIVSSKKNSDKEEVSPDDIREGIYNRLEEGAKDTTKINLNKVDLVLYDDGKGVIEPAYHVEAQLFYENKKNSYDVPFDFYVPILKRPHAFYPFMDKPNNKAIKDNGEETPNFIDK
jgi:hypothetical protein